MTVYMPGDLVLCIDDAAPVPHNLVAPVRGCVYTVRSSVVSGDGINAVTLEEIPDQPLQIGDRTLKICFAQSRFRLARRHARSMALLRGAMHGTIVAFTGDPQP